MADVVVEVRLLHPESEGEGGVGAEVPTFDGVVVEKLLGKQGFGRVVAVGEM